MKTWWAYWSQVKIVGVISFLGYRLKLEDRGEKEYTGKIHVDYAQARDDQYEFECAQRALEREQRHLRLSPPPSPPPPAHYTDTEASHLLDKLKGRRLYLFTKTCPPRRDGTFLKMQITLCGVRAE